MQQSCGKNTPRNQMWQMQHLGTILMQKNKVTNL